MKVKRKVILKLITLLLSSFQHMTATYNYPHDNYNNNDIPVNCANLS